MIYYNCVLRWKRLTSSAEKRKIEIKPGVYGFESLRGVYSECDIVNLNDEFWFGGFRKI